MGIGDLSNGPTAFASKIPVVNILSVYGSCRNSEWQEIEKAVQGILDKIFVEHGIHLLMSRNYVPVLFDYKTKSEYSIDYSDSQFPTSDKWLYVDTEYLEAYRARFSKSKGEPRDGSSFVSSVSYP